MYVYSLADGTIESLEKVPDEMFSEKVLGDGVALIADEEWLYSPCDGEITMIFDTKHAVGITANDGTEILIHIGVDTMNLKGEPFVVYVEKGEKVKKGDLMMHVDFGLIKEKNLYPGVMTIITNKKPTILKNDGKVKKSDPLLEIL